MLGILYSMHSRNTRLRVFAVVAAVVTVGAGASGAQERNTARVEGRVIDFQGAPVPHARVSITVAQGIAVVNDSGRFSFEGLRAGDAILEIRALGYPPHSRRVRLVRDSTTRVEIQFAERVAMLAEVQVRARRHERNMEEFERRRLAGFGHYMTPEELAIRAPARLAMTVAHLPGLNLACPRGGTDCVIMMNRAGGVAGSGVATGNLCEPSIYIDGRLDQTGMAYSMYSDQIAAVEVYPRSATRPQEFVQDTNSCGVIAIWRLPPELDPRESGDVTAAKKCGGRLNLCYARQWLPLIALVGVGFVAFW